MFILNSLSFTNKKMFGTLGLKRVATMVALGSTLLMMAACTALPASGPDANPESPASLDETEQALVTQATADLAAKLNVETDAIELKSIEAVEWGDSSLGCPEEGMMYAAVITPGYQITLAHDGEEYVYHTGADADGPVIHCAAKTESSSPDAGGEAPADPTQGLLVNLAKQDLANQLGVNVDAIEVTAVEPVEWGDSSLGCPQPDMAYAQMITPGYQITLTHDGEEYVYHTGADVDSPIINCTDNTDGANADGDGELAVGAAQLVMLAKEDLAAQLGVDVESIETTAVEAVDWNDSSLGCPQPDMMYAQVITPGYRITLNHDGQEYIYHTGADTSSPVINCSDHAADDETTGDTEELAPMLTMRETLVARAIADLVQRQGVESNAVEVKTAQGVEWRDGSLGCAKAGMMYPQVITPGYRIILTVDGVDYAYHTAARKDGPVKYCRGVGKSGSDDGTYQTE